MYLPNLAGGTCINSVYRTYRVTVWNECCVIQHGNRWVNWHSYMFWVSCISS